MNVLFLCRGNVFRSQLAEYFFNELTKKHHASSAGIEDKPYHGISLEDIFKMYPHTVKIIEKHGFNLRRHIPKKITLEMIEKADTVVVILEDENLIPNYLKDSDKLVFWKIEDGVDEEGKLKSFEALDKIIEKVRPEVKKLINALK